VKDLEYLGIRNTPEYLSLEEYREAVKAS